jgi:hypothetical protein
MRTLENPRYSSEFGNYWAGSLLGLLHGRITYNYARPFFAFTLGPVTERWTRCRVPFAPEQVSKGKSVFRVMTCRRAGFSLGAS